MSHAPVKTRFAPSPTGEMHLGNLRTALFNVLLARRDKGGFLLRIEDTDPERSREDYILQLVEDLRWLGIFWDEGPEQDGPGGPYRQSERAEVYSRYFEQLGQQELVYPCFCSQQQLALARKVQRAAGQPPRYGGTCAHLSAAEVESRFNEGQSAVLRFRVPAGKQVEFDDLVRGQQHFDTDTIGDFIVRRTNGTPAFFFCNAVDDALMGITHVLRGEDHLSNTPRQLLLLESLGLSAPHYGHISLIVSNDGAPLSKRHGSKSVRVMREEGLHPVALLNYLARLGHTYEANEYMNLDGLAEHFEIGKLGRAPARFDQAQLLHWQREALTREEPGALWDWMSSTVGELVAEENRDVFVNLVRDNILKPDDARCWARILYGQELEIEVAARDAIVAAGEDFFRHLLNAWNEGVREYSLLVAKLKESTGKKGKALFQPLRASLTGTLHGPELERILKVLTSDQVCSRLEACIAITKPDS